MHRVAYLLRIRREDPRGILVLAYNRHAASEIRARLAALVGEDVRGVTVCTCHALAMRLVGASFSGFDAQNADFDRIVTDAAQLLNGDGLSKSEAEAQRDSLLDGYRWILVDEYQDIGPEEYALISAVAGRSLEDADLKLSLFAVGDDDQNIYAFTGASVHFIRQFEADYHAKPCFLIENYRSTANIIAASNAVIEKAQGRMKAEQIIRINAARSVGNPGGRMASADPVAQGRVQLLDVPPGPGPQAIAAIDELLRLAALDPQWDWRKTAIISREWKSLDAVRSYAEAKGISVDMANEDLPTIWRLRETQAFVAALRAKGRELLGLNDILGALNAQQGNKWTELLAEGVADLARELRDKTMPAPDVIEWVAEWARDTRGAQRGLLLTTAHRAKGLEFDHVVILNGGWNRASRNEDTAAPRRLFYVAMTRARRSLAVMTSGSHALMTSAGDAVLRRAVTPRAEETCSPARIYQLPSLKSVDLSFAGRKPPNDPVHAATGDAQTGDEITLEYRAPHWDILDRKGRKLGRMAKNWKPPEGTSFLSGTIGAIVIWRKTDNKDEFQRHIRRDEWETVLPSLSFKKVKPDLMR